MKIVAVCGFGVGSSLLLKMTIDKAFKLLGYDLEAENTDLTTARSIACDAIFTSVDMAEEFREIRKVPVYAIKSYMSVDEVKRALEDFIRVYKEQHS